MKLTRDQANKLGHIEPFLPFDNPTFGNPAFDAASYRVLILRLSPFRDVDRSLPHLFLFQEVRRALPDAFIDLAFFPTAAHRERFERDDVPFLLGTQSLRSADEFDLILISNAYTLELINLPYLLIRSGIPLFASQRGSDWPIIILGGSNAMATQAIVRHDGDSLVDGIFFGEGEGWVGDLVRFLQRNRNLEKERLLAQAEDRVTGLWAAGSLHATAKAVLSVPQARLLPVGYPVLNSPEVHEANLQITYGCPAFCAFCFEGYDRKPYRELPLTDVMSAAFRVKRAQGVEELNLYSFNFNTHQHILQMISDLHRLFDRVSFKSQRLDVLYHAGYLLEAEVAADKRDFTLGIEGISQRQRTWLHKSLSTEDVAALLQRLFKLKIRRVKLFYVLTGHETEQDVAEFHRFVKWLKRARRSLNRRLRVVFSFGPLIRMPFTPLRYDRLSLDEDAWRPLVGRIKSACETNGFEFRLAFDWPDYCVTQVLAMGGYWLVEPVVGLAQQGYCYDAALPPEYWEELRRWMTEAGYWNDGFLGEKGADYRFPLAFIESDVPAEFLYRQYQEAQAGKDSGYCLGDRERPGHCLGCGACLDREQRRSITHHEIHRPARHPYMSQLQAVMDRKRRLQPAYFVLRVDPLLAGVVPECLNAFVFRDLLARYPELADNLLSVRESLFTVDPNAGRFPPVSGETVFALKAWDAAALEPAFFDFVDRKALGSQLPIAEVLRPAEGFTSGAFTRLHLDLHLPAEFFPEPRARLEQYLRGAYLPYSLRRERSRLQFDLPDKALKKKILFDGFIETETGKGGGIGAEKSGFLASLDIGPKFDLAAFLHSFARPNPGLHARAEISKIDW